MERISFSIVMVCLNPGEKLRTSVESVLGQTYPDFELLIKDGGSRDASLDNLPADPRIRVEKRTDKGIYDAMNQALESVEKKEGRYVQFLNCGDAFHDETVLERIAKAIEDGANCLGYHYWGAIDNWSWCNAFKNRYGFVRVCLDDGYKRKEKKSASWMREVARTKEFE